MLTLTSPLTELSAPGFRNTISVNLRAQGWLIGSNSPSLRDQYQHFSDCNGPSKSRLLIIPNMAGLKNGANGETHTEAQAKENVTAIAPPQTISAGELPIIHSYTGKIFI